MRDIVNFKGQSIGQEVQLNGQWFPVRNVQGFKLTPVGVSDTSTGLAVTEWASEPTLPELPSGCRLSLSGNEITAVKYSGEGSWTSAKKASIYRLVNGQWVGDGTFSEV